MTHFFAWDNKGGKGPWGSSKPNRTSGSGNKGSSGGGGNRGPEAPDIDDLLRHAQKHMKFMGGGNGGGGFNRRIFGLAIMAIVFVWLASGFYIVAPDEQGVVMRFGRYIQTTDPGLNYHLPYPVEEVVKPKVTRENVMEVGFRSAQPMGTFMGRTYSRQLDNSNVADVSEESKMLTGDENIIDLDFTVRWKIADARDFLFNISNQQSTIKNAAESAMREIVGRHPIDDVLTDNKFQVQQEAKALLQDMLDSYRAGVQINGVELQQVNPPEAVVDAFRDVQAARADAEKMQNQARGYANDILPRARGQAAQIMQGAQAYRASKIAESEGQANRFKLQLTEFSKAEEVTSKRMYLETMEDVLKDARKVVITGEAGKGVLPYLPLESLKGGR